MEPIGNHQIADFPSFHRASSVGASLARNSRTLLAQEVVTGEDFYRTRYSLA